MRKGQKGVRYTATSAADGWTGATDAQCKDQWTCTLSGWKKKVHVEEHSFF